MVRRFEAVCNKVKIIDDYPFKLRYKGHNASDVAKKYAGASEVRVVGDMVFVEAGRMENKVR